MGDCISRPEMDGRRKCQSPSTVHEREVQLEASMLSYLVVQHGVPYTAAHSYGQSSAAGCQDEGPGTETLVWRATGRDVGSTCHISHCLTFAYLSQQWHCPAPTQATVPGRSISAYLDGKDDKVQ